jgi:hypothetical protein
LEPRYAAVLEVVELYCSVAAVAGLHFAGDSVCTEACFALQLSSATAEEVLVLDRSDIARLQYYSDYRLFAGSYC